MVETEEIEDFGFSDDILTLKSFLEECDDQVVSLINTQVKCMAKDTKLYNFTDIINGSYARYLKMQLVFNKKNKLPQNTSFLGKK